MIVFIELEFLCLPNKSEIHDEFLWFNIFSFPNVISIVFQFRDPLEKFQKGLLRPVRAEPYEFRLPQTILLTSGPLVVFKFNDIRIRARAVSHSMGT